MKNKTTSIIMTIVMLLLIVILIIIGIIFYEKFMDIDIGNKVQDFVSNIQVVSGEKENIEIPQIIESTSTSLEDTNIDYSTIHINKYFYNQLDNYSKIIYNAMESNKEKMKTGTYEINLGTEFSNLLSQEEGEKLLGEYYQSAIEAYTYDNPDVFYLNASKMYLNIETTTKVNKVTYKVLINSGEATNYLSDEFSSEEQINDTLAKIEQVRNNIIRNKKEDTYLNIKMAHDYLIESIEYEDNSSESNVYNIYGALINKRCVCEGYAKSFKYLMDALDVPCVLVIGKGTNSNGNTENHAWNYVEINEKWYAIDCTWDDPIIIGGGKVGQSAKYKYFLKGENEFNETHIPEGQFTEGGKVFKYPTLTNQNYK